MRDSVSPAGADMDDEEGTRWLASTRLRASQKPRFGNRALAIAAGVLALFGAGILAVANRTPSASGPVAAAPPSPPPAAPARPAPVAAAPEIAKPEPLLRPVVRQPEMANAPRPATPATPQAVVVTGQPVTTPPGTQQGVTQPLQTQPPLQTVSGRTGAPVAQRAPTPAATSAPMNLQGAAPASPEAAPARARTAAAPLAPPQERPAASPANPADAPAANATPATYAIYLDTYPDEGQARSSLGDAQRKYGSQLGGARLSYKRTSNGAYRVRAVGLTQEKANSICSRLRGSGGACDVGQR